MTSGQCKKDGWRSPLLTITFHPLAATYLISIGMHRFSEDAETLPQASQENFSSSFLSLQTFSAVTAHKFSRSISFTGLQSLLLSFAVTPQF
jgi:hypothetical protein